MRVVWTPEAQQDRAEVWDYIAADNPRAAVRMDEIFSNTAAKLTQYRMLGKPGPIPGTREIIPHESYRLVNRMWQHWLSLQKAWLAVVVGARWNACPSLS